MLNLVEDDKKKYMASTTDSATLLLKDVTSDLFMSIIDRIISKSNLDV